MMKMAIKDFGGVALLFAGGQDLPGRYKICRSVLTLWGVLFQCYSSLYHPVISVDSHHSRVGILHLADSETRVLP